MIDVRRMIQQPNSTQDITTTIRDMLVFAMSVPFMGAPSMTVQQLQEWVRFTWNGLPSAVKKPGTVNCSSILSTEVQQWWLPPKKVCTMGMSSASKSFKLTQQLQDGTTWCDYSSGILPMVSLFFPYALCQYPYLT